MDSWVFILPFDSSWPYLSNWDLSCLFFYFDSFNLFWICLFSFLIFLNSKLYYCNRSFRFPIWVDSSFLGDIMFVTVEGLSIIGNSTNGATELSRISLFNSKLYGSSVWISWAFKPSFSNDQVTFFTNDRVWDLMYPDLLKGFKVLTITTCFVS